MLPTVSRQFAEVYAQYNIGKLHERIADLEYELFAAELPPIGECTRMLNENIVRCCCYQCISSGRMPFGTRDIDMDCTLTPEFMRIVFEACKTFPVDSNGGMELPIWNPAFMDWKEMTWITKVPRHRRAEWKNACGEIVAKTYKTKPKDDLLMDCLSQPYEEADWATVHSDSDGNVTSSEFGSDSIVFEVSAEAFKSSEDPPDSNALF